MCCDALLPLAAGRLQEVAPSLGPLHPAMVHCIAAILWTVAEMRREDVQQLIPSDLVTSVSGEFLVPG